MHLHYCSMKSILGVNKRENERELWIKRKSYSIKEEDTRVENPNSGFYFPYWKTEKKAEFGLTIFSGYKLETNGRREITGKKENKKKALEISRTECKKLIYKLTLKGEQVGGMQPSKVLLGTFKMHLI